MTNCPVCERTLVNFAKTTCRRCSEYKPCLFCQPCEYAVCQPCLQRRPEQAAGGELMSSDFEV